MNVTFEEISALAKSRYGEAFSSQGGNAFSLALKEVTIEFFHAAGDTSAAFIRAKILSMDDVKRAGDFAKAALAGNFFWGGTRGATLSVGLDNVLYATDRRPLDELGDEDGLGGCVEDFMETIADWQERSVLYA